MIADKEVHWLSKDVGYLPFGCCLCPLFARMIFIVKGGAHLSLIFLKIAENRPIFVSGLRLNINML